MTFDDKPQRWVVYHDDAVENGERIYIYTEEASAIAAIRILDSNHTLIHVAHMLHWETGEPGWVELKLIFKHWNDKLDLHISDYVQEDHYEMGDLPWHGEDLAPDEDHFLAPVVKALNESL
jgi:hypothetical protein